MRSFLGICASALFSASPFFYTPERIEQTAVLTGQYDAGRTAAYLHEPILNLRNVNATTFGKVGSYQLDGLVYAQPLFVPGVVINGRRTNVLYVVTMHNSLYALDADHPGSSPLWQVSFGPSVPARWAGTCPGGELGVLGTPVIDPERSAIYLVSATPDSGAATYVHRLFALDIRNGASKFGSPMSISASFPGTGSDSQNGTVPMNETRMMQRPALLLSKGVVYAGFGGCGPDPIPYHGWLLGYKADDVQSQVAVFNTTPNSDGGSIWQSGRGLVADDNGSIYFMTGNGFGEKANGGYGETFVKLSRSGELMDSFAPGDKLSLDGYDLDLGSSGPILAPDSHLLLGGGKEGVVYALDPNHLNRSSLPAQSFQATQSCGTFAFSGCQQIHYPAYWARHGFDGRDLGGMLYVWGYGDNLRAYRYSQGSFGSAPDSEGSVIESRGGNLSISAKSPMENTAILWARSISGLHAYDARNVTSEIWNSNQNSTRDAIGSYFGLSLYTIANGRVYVPVGSKSIDVYGLLPVLYSTATADGL